jgi:hypothetical protein
MVADAGTVLTNLGTVAAIGLLAIVLHSARGRALRARPQSRLTQSVGASLPARSALPCSQLMGWPCSR